MPFAPSLFVEIEIACDSQQPGGEFRGRPVTRCALPDPHKNLLRHVLDIGIVTEHSPNCANDQRLMTFDEPLERSDIAACRFCHQGSIVKLAGALLRHEKGTTDTRPPLFV